MVVVGYRVNVGLLAGSVSVGIEVVVVGYRVNVGLLAGSVSVRY